MRRFGPLAAHQDPEAVMAELILLASFPQIPDDVFPTASIAMMTATRMSPKSTAYSAAVTASSSWKSLRNWLRISGATL